MKPILPTMKERKLAFELIVKKRGQKDFQAKQKFYVATLNEIQLGVLKYLFWYRSGQEVSKGVWPLV